MIINEPEIIKNAPELKIDIFIKVLKYLVIRQLK
jgi:hypothetical protein